MCADCSFSVNYERVACASGSVFMIAKAFIIFRSEVFAIMKYLLREPMRAITSISGAPVVTIREVTGLPWAETWPQLRQNPSRSRLARENLRLTSLRRRE